MKYNKICLDKSIDGIFNAISLVAILLIEYFLNQYNDNIPYAINWFYIFIGAVFQITSIIEVNNFYPFEKVIHKGRKSLFRWPIGICILSLIEIYVQYITMGNTHGPVHKATSVVIFPFCILLMNDYLHKLNAKTKILDEVRKRITLTKVRIYALCAMSYLYVHWYSYDRSNFSTFSLAVNMVNNWIMISVLLIQCTYVYYGLQYAQKTEEKFPFKVYFPYNFLITAAIGIMVWGSMAFISTDFVLEGSFYVTVLIYIIVYAIFAGLIHGGIKSKMCLRDWKILAGTAVIMATYAMLVHNASITNRALAGDFIGIGLSTIGLLGLFLVVIICNLPDKKADCSEDE